jgi:hypothetical protein
MNKIDPEASMEIAKKLAVHLEGEHPALQGAAIAETLGTYLAGYQEKEVRTLVLEKLLNMAWKVVEICDHDDEGENASKH